MASASLHRQADLFVGERRLNLGDRDLHGIATGDQGLVLGQMLIVVGHDNYLAKFREEFSNEG